MAERKKIEDMKWEDAKEKMYEARDTTEEYIRENPMKAVLIAAGIGAVIGFGIMAGKEMMARRRSFWH